MQSNEGSSRDVVVQRTLPTDPAVRGTASLFLTEAGGQGIEAARRMLLVGPESATEDVSLALGVEPGSQVLARRKLLLAGEVPLRVATSYLRLDLFGDTALAQPAFLEPSLQAAIEDLGYRFGRAEEHLVARPASGEEARVLQLDEGEWVVRILRVSFDRDGAPVHALETVCAASRHVFPIRQLPGKDQF
jgi:GntR family transcriptional regulator